MPSAPPSFGMPRAAPSSLGLHSTDAHIVPLSPAHHIDMHTHQKQKNTTDPFSSAAAEETNDEAEYVHIRVQQRNGKKSLTTVQGLKKAYDYKKVLKALKKGESGFLSFARRFFLSLERAAGEGRCRRCRFLSPLCLHL